MNIRLGLQKLRRMYFVTGQMVQRDIAQRYRGSVGGLFWAMVQPLMMLGVYTVVFGAILKVKWPGINSALEYSLILFLGLVPYMFVSESISRAPSLIISNVNLVKKVVFPLQILPVMSAATSAVHSGIALLVWGGFYFCVTGSLPWVIFVMPIIWIPLIFVTLGVCWAFASIGAYFRDLIHAVGPITLALMFLSPIFYSYQMAPASLRPILQANPLGFAIESARKMVFQNTWPTVGDYMMQVAIGITCAAAGLALFFGTRDGFVDTV